MANPVLLYLFLVNPLFYLFLSYSWLLSGIRLCQTGLRIVYWYRGNNTYVGGKRIVLHTTLPVLLMAPKALLDKNLALPLPQITSSLRTDPPQSQEFLIAEDQPEPVITFEFHANHAFGLTSAPLAGMSLASWSAHRYSAIEEQLFQRVVTFAEQRRAAGQALTTAEQDALLLDVFHIALGQTAL